MELLKKVQKTITKYSMLSEHDQVLIGLSGGPDSVCLAVILDKLKDKFNIGLHAVYVNHGLRPDENRAEELFCRDFCEKMEICFHVRSVDVRQIVSESNVNVQEAAREVRYEVFEDLAQEIDATKIAVAHNADDQAETVFMRLIRGAGRKGLSGIPPTRGMIIRPLLELERAEIEHFLIDEQGQTYITDSSNMNENYLRNWLRLNVMSEIKKHNPLITKEMTKTSDIFREEDAYLELIVTKTLMRLITRKDETSIELFLTPLQSLEIPIVRRVLRRAIDATSGLRGIGFIHIEDIIHLIREGRSGDRLTLPRGLRVVRNYATLLLTRDTPVSFAAHDLPVPGEIIIRDLEIIIEAEMHGVQEEEDDDSSRAFIDYEKVALPLCVRPRQNGDFFYPRGLGKRKKLQDFFVDEKVPRDLRDSVPIVVSGNDIIWVAGYRADDRYKVTATTGKVLKLIVSKTS